MDVHQDEVVDLAFFQHSLDMVVRLVTILSSVDYHIRFSQDRLDVLNLGNCVICNQNVDIFRVKVETCPVLVPSLDVSLVHGLDEGKIGMFFHEFLVELYRLRLVQIEVLI